MNKRYFGLALILAMMVILQAGCMSVVVERQGTRAYLKKDYDTARMKFEEAASQGNAQAMYHLAVMHAEGLGGRQDFPRAAELLEQAVAQGHDDARLMLGLFNIYGDGVPRNPAKGAALIAASAEDGNDTAMYYLANLHAAGLGVEKNLDHALLWMQKAKDAGFPAKEELLTRGGLAALYE